MSRSLTGVEKWILFLNCLCNVTISFNTGAISASIPVISRDLGHPDLDVARVIAFYMIPYGFGALIYAPLTRILSYRCVLVLCMIVYSVLSLMCGFMHSLDWIKWAQVGMGITAASSTPLALMIIGEQFEKSMRGRMVGIYFGSAFMAALIGVALSGVISWRMLFILPAFIGFFSALCCLLPLSKSIDRRHEAPVNYWHAIQRRHILRIFCFIFIMSFLYHAVHKWYGVYLSQIYHFDKSLISFFLTITALCGLFGQQIGGFLSDKLGRLIAARVGALILAIGVMALFGVYSKVFLGLILAFVSIGWTISHNGISTVLTDFPDDERPIIASLNSSVRFVSGGLGFLISSWFVQYSFGWTFLGIGLTMLLMSVFLKHIIPEGR